MFGKKSSIIGALILGALAASTASLANTSASTRSLNSTPGFYVGGQAGFAKADYGDSSSDSDQGGPSFRLLDGYSFNQYFAVENSYNYFPTNKLNFWGYIVKEETQAFDLVAKGSFPITPNLSLYGKAGPAYVMAKIDSAYYEETASAIQLTYGAGVEVHANNAVSFNISWSQINGEDSDTELNTPTTNFFGLGINCKFS